MCKKVLQIHPFICGVWLIVTAVLGFRIVSKLLSHSICSYLFCTITTLDFFFLAVPSGFL